jgi:Zn-dependent peptidase ImmA (M78 family)/DNA-binding XRE family transcriptional regulator
MNVLNGGQRRPLPRPIPERIKEAREARGYTPDVFAEHLDVTRQTLAQYETGQIVPSGEVMGKIIALTGQPPAFFVTTQERPGSCGTPFWRSLKRMEAHHRRRIARRLQWARDITTFIERFIEVPEVKLPSIEFDPRSDDEEQIERAAERLRDFWGLGRGPIKDLTSILEANGIVLVREPVDCPDMDAVSVWQGGRPFILLSAEVSSGPRSLFNLAHELAHILLHAGVEVSIKNLDLIEKQANRFAGAFLLPRESFSQEVLGTSISYFKSLKARWGVAISAMAYRCKDLQIFNANQHAYLMKQMNAMRIRKSEPLDDVVTIRSPSILAESIKMLMQHGVQTRDQIESALNLNLSDVESLCGVQKGYLDSRVVQFQPRPRERLG